MNNATLTIGSVIRESSSVSSSLEHPRPNLSRNDESPTAAST